MTTQPSVNHKGSKSRSRWFGGEFVALRSLATESTEVTEWPIGSLILGALDYEIIFSKPTE